MARTYIRISSFLPFSFLFLQKYLVISIALGIIGVTGFLWQSSQLTFKQINTDIEDLRAKTNSFECSSNLPQGGFLIFNHLFNRLV